MAPGPQVPLFVLSEAVGRPEPHPLIALLRMCLDGALEVATAISTAIRAYDCLAAEVPDDYASRLHSQYE